MNQRWSNWPAHWPHIDIVIPTAILLACLTVLMDSCTLSGGVSWFMHRKCVPRSILKPAYSNTCYLLLHSTFTDMSWKSIPVSAKVRYISAQFCLQWPVAITSLQIVEQSSAFISLQLCWPIRRLYWKLLEQNHLHPRKQLSVALSMRSCVCTACVSGKFVFHRIKIKMFYVFYVL